MLLLKRLRTRLSIPFGLRHDEGTHLKRSDWWRQKRCLPVAVVSPPFVSRCESVDCSEWVPPLSFISFFSSFLQATSLYPFRPFSFLSRRLVKGWIGGRIGIGHTLLHDRDVLLCEDHL